MFVPTLWQQSHYHPKLTRITGFGRPNPAGFHNFTYQADKVGRNRPRHDLNVTCGYGLLERPLLYRERLLELGDTLHATWHHGGFGSSN